MSIDDLKKLVQLVYTQKPKAMQNLRSKIPCPIDKNRAWVYTEENNHTFIDFDVGYTDYFEFTSDGRLIYTNGYDTWIFTK